MPQHNVRVRVQVIDAQPSILTTTVATYLPMDQLTQLIARESGLQAFWPNGVRRLYWLRARGRLLQPNQTLAEVGVVGDELVYLLPQPPPDMSAFEQSPDYPERHPYLGQGYPVLVLKRLASCSGELDGVWLSNESNMVDFDAPWIWFWCAQCSFCEAHLGGGHLVFVCWSRPFCLWF